LTRHSARQVHVTDVGVDDVAEKYVLNTIGTNAGTGYGGRHHCGTKIDRRDILEAPAKLANR
jgi:hypothetical protein